MSTTTVQQAPQYEEPLRNLLARIGDDGVTRWLSNAIDYYERVKGPNTHANMGAAAWFAQLEAATEFDECVSCLLPDMEEVMTREQLFSPETLLAAEVLADANQNEEPEPIRRAVRLFYRLRHGDIQHQTWLATARLAAKQSRPEPAPAVVPKTDHTDATAPAELVAVPA